MIPSLFTRFYYSKFFSIAVLLFLSMYNVSHAVTYASDGIVGNTYYYTSQIGVGAPWGGYVLTGQIPPGLTFSWMDASFTGVPTTVGTYNFTIDDTYCNNWCAPMPDSITIYPAVAVSTPVAPQPQAFGGFTTGVAMSFTLPVFVDINSPALPLTYSVVNLPAGLSFNPTTRVVSGTPSTAGVFSATYSATNGTKSSSVNVDIQVLQGYIFGPNPNGYKDPQFFTYTRGSNMSFILPSTNDGNNPALPLTYSIPNLPAGLSFDPITKVVSGIPSNEGTISFLVNISNGYKSVSNTINFVINPLPPIVQNQGGLAAGLPMPGIITLPAFTNTNAPIYAASLALTYSISGLPAGLTFDPLTRIISGTPTTTGVSTVTYTARDLWWITSSVQFTITVNNVPFVCGSTVSIGGFTYTTAAGADGNCWTSQNMKHTPSVGNSWSNGTERFYSWSAANGNLCSQLGNGWALPSDTQWTTLTSSGATGWLGNKLSGITSALPGRYTTITSSLITQGEWGYWWSSTQYSGNLAYSWVYMLKSIDSGVTRGINNGDSYFHSVVCVNTTSTVAPVVLKTYTGAIEFDKSFINYANVNTSSLLIPTQLVSTGATKVDMIDSNKSLTATNSFLQQSKAGMVRMGKFFFKASH